MIYDESAWLDEMEAQAAAWANKKKAVDIAEAVEDAVDPLLALLFAVVHGHIGQNADGDEMIKLSTSDYRRIQAACVSGCG